MKIQNNSEYKYVMAQIEVYLQKATHNGGFQSLDTSEVKILQQIWIWQKNYIPNSILTLGLF